MKCPDCNNIITKVIDSRITEKDYFEKDNSNNKNNNSDKTRN